VLGLIVSDRTCLASPASRDAEQRLHYVNATPPACRQVFSFRFVWSAVGLRPITCIWPTTRNVPAAENASAGSERSDANSPLTAAWPAGAASAKVAASRNAVRRIRLPVPMVFSFPGYTMDENGAGPPVAD